MVGPFQDDLLGMTLRAQSGDTANAAELYARSGAAAYGVSAEQFTLILIDIQRKYVPNGSADERADFCAALRLEELVLARACAAGNERAWEDFISRYRQKLYGMGARSGVRNSKLVFYTGRGSLEGWLRTVMSQEFINRYRKQKRVVSLEEQTEEGG